MTGGAYHFSSDIAQFPLMAVTLDTGGCFLVHGGGGFIAAHEIVV